MDRRMSALLFRLLRDRRGSSAVEYGLICALIVIAIIAALQAFAGQTIAMWGNVSTKVSAATQQ